MEYALWNGQKISALAMSKEYEIEKKIRAASANGELKCPDPKCQRPILKYCHGEVKGAYFAHCCNNECDYASFDRQNTDTVQHIQRKLYEHFMLAGNEITMEQKILPHHYAHLLMKTESGEKLAVEIKTKSTIVSLWTHWISEYQKAGIEINCLVVGNTDQPIEEDQLGYLKRYELNESQNGTLLVVNEQCTEITQYKMDPNSYCYHGQEIRSKNYPAVYMKTAPVEALMMRGQSIELDGFTQSYSRWLKRKQAAFQELITQKEEEQAKEAERYQRRMEEERRHQKQKQKEATRSAKQVKSAHAEKNEQLRRISDEECRAEILPRMNQVETPVWDSNGRKWIRCIQCGKIAPEENFPDYGGKHRATLGICWDCARKRR